MDILKAVEPLFQFSRLCGFAPYTVRSGNLVKSSSWFTYSCILLLFNMICQSTRQINNFIAFIEHRQLREFVAIFDVFAFGFNGVCSAVFILAKSEALFKAVNRMNLYQRKIFRTRSEETGSTRLKAAALAVGTATIGCLLPIGTTVCWKLNKNHKIIMRLISLFMRTQVTLAISILFTAYLFILKFYFADVTKVLVRREWNKVKKMSVMDHLLKDITELVNKTFGGFNLFMCLATFFEVIYVTVYNVLILETVCSTVLGALWILYCCSLLCGSLVSSILTARQVGIESITKK